MSWVTLRKSHTWEDVYTSLEFMPKNKIILIELIDETGCLINIIVFENILRGIVESGMKRKYQRMNACK
jgi:hypothetical protein